MSTNRMPKPGDLYEVRRPGKRMIRKVVGRLYEREHRASATSGKYRSVYVEWFRLPKGRYSGIWISDLLDYGKRIAREVRGDYFNLYGEIWHDKNGLVKGQL